MRDNIKLSINVDSEDELKIIVNDYLTKGFKITKQTYGNVILNKTKYKKLLLTLIIPYIIFVIIARFILNFLVPTNLSIKIIVAIIIFIVWILIIHFEMDFIETIEVQNLNKIPEEVWDIMD